MVVLMLRNTWWICVLLALLSNIAGQHYSSSAWLLASVVLGAVGALSLVFSPVLIRKMQSDKSKAS